MHSPLRRTKLTLPNLHLPLHLRMHSSIIPPLHLRHNHLPRLHIHLPLRMILQRNPLILAIHCHRQPHIIAIRSTFAIPTIAHINICRFLAPLDSQFECILTVIRFLGVRGDAKGSGPGTSAEVVGVEHLIGIAAPAGFSADDEIVCGLVFEEARGFVGAFC